MTPTPGLVGAEIVEYLPASLVVATVGQSVELAVTLANSTATPWTFIARAIVRDAGGAVVGFYSTALSSSLPPGHSVTVRWPHTVTSPGSFWLQFDVWKATPYTADNLLARLPTPAELLIVGQSTQPPPPTPTTTATPTPDFDDDF